MTRPLSDPSGRACAGVWGQGWDGQDSRDRHRNPSPSPTHACLRRKLCRRESFPTSTVAIYAQPTFTGARRCAVARPRPVRTACMVGGSASSAPFPHAIPAPHTQMLLGDEHAIACLIVRQIAPSWSIRQRATKDNRPHFLINAAKPLPNHRTLLLNMRPIPSHIKIASTVCDIASAVAWCV